MVSDLGIYLARISLSIYDHRDLLFVQVWYRFFGKVLSTDLMHSRQFVRVHIEFCVSRKFVVWRSVILMAFNPLCFYAATEGFGEFLDGCRIIVILWSSRGSMGASSDKIHSADCRLAICQPSQLAFMTEAPVGSQ
jgi:hypothetical protein